MCWATTAHNARLSQEHVYSKLKASICNMSLVHTWPMPADLYNRAQSLSCGRVGEGVAMRVQSSAAVLQSKLEERFMIVM